MAFEEEPRLSFEEEWPELARRLDGFLAAKGVEAWLRADVVQETATRVYRKWPRFDRSRPLWNLVVTIALGILVDEYRRTSKISLFSDVPQAEVDDVETRAAHRVHLVKTRAALRHLREDQRRVLLAEIGEASLPGGSRNRVNVLRLRARLALKSELGPWAPAAVALRVRSLRASFERRILGWGSEVANSSASLVSVGAAAAVILIAGAGADVATSDPPAGIAQDARILALDRLHDLRLRDALADSPRVERSNLDSKATDRADEETGYIADAPLYHWENAKRQYVRTKNRTFDTFYDRYDDTKEKAWQEKDKASEQEEKVEDEAWRKVDELP